MLTPEEILKGNDLLSWFMGWYTTPHPSGQFWMIKIDIDMNLYRGDNDIQKQRNSVYYVTSPMKMKFHSSWNWLMPVIVKIDEVFEDNMPVIFTEIIGRSCCISTMVNHNWPNDKDIFSEYNTTNSETKMEAIYKACVEFMEWYKPAKLGLPVPQDESPKVCSIPQPDPTVVDLIELTKNPDFMNGKLAITWKF